MSDVVRYGLGFGVEPDGLPACAESATDIGVEVVADDKVETAGCGCATLGILEKADVGFVDSGIVAEHNAVEIAVDSGGAQFVVLHLMETVADNAHAIAEALELVEQVASAIDQGGLAAETREIFAVEAGRKAVGELRVDPNSAQGR